MSIRRICSTLMVITISGTMGYYVFSKIPMASLSQAFAEVHIAVSAVLILIVALITVFHIARWLIMCHIILPSLGRRTLIRNLLLGIFLNQTVPLGGDAARIVHLTYQNTPLSQSIVCMLFDKLFALLALFFIAFSAIAFEYFLFSNSQLSIKLHEFIIPILLFLALIICSFILVLFTQDKMLKLLEKRQSSFFRLLRQLITTMQILRNNKSKTFMCLTLAICIQLCTCSVAAAVILFAGWNFEPFALFSMVAFILILAYLPISLAGWGVRETGFILIAPLVAITEAQGLVIALFLGSSQLVQGLICGTIFLLSSFKHSPA